MQQDKNKTLTSEKHIAPIKLRGDKKIWAILFLLAFISILAVSSSSYKLTLYKGNFSFIFRHIVFMFAGFATLYFFHKIPVDKVKRLAPVALLFIALLLFVVLIFSSTGRWLEILGFQPSEFAKLTIVIYLAKTLSEKIKTGVEFFTLVLLPVGICCGLIIFGHTSTVLIIGLNTIVLVLMAANRKYIAITVISVLLTIGLYKTFETFFPRSSTANNRVSTYIEHILHKTKPEVGSQEYYAMQAINRGGIIRIAPGKSKYREKLTQANNDFIFAIIVEEYGIAGGMLVVCLYLILFYRVMVIIRQCKKSFTALIAGGLFFMIIIQTFINIGVSVGALPVTGQNLPMISSGGSSIITTCIAFGLILSISRRIEELKVKQAGTYRTHPKLKNRKI